MSEKDEDDPFQGLVTSQSMGADRELEHSDGQFAERDNKSLEPRPSERRRSRDDE